MSENNKAESTRVRHGCFKKQKCPRRTHTHRGKTVKKPLSCINILGGEYVDVKV